MASPITWQSIAAPNFSSSNSSSTSGQRNFNDSLDSFGKASTNLNNTLTGIDDTARKENTGKLAASLFGKSDADVQAIMEGIPADANIDNNVIFDFADKQRMNNSTLAQQASATAGNVIANQSGQLTLDAQPEKQKQELRARGLELDASQFKVNNQQGEFNLNQESTRSGIDANKSTISLNGIRGQSAQQEVDAQNIVVAEKALKDEATKVLLQVKDNFIDKDKNRIDEDGLNNLLASFKDSNGQPKYAGVMEDAMASLLKETGVDRNKASATSLQDSEKTQSEIDKNKSIYDASVTKEALSIASAEITNAISTSTEGVDWLYLTDKEKNLREEYSARLLSYVQSKEYTKDEILTAIHAYQKSNGKDSMNVNSVIDLAKKNKNPLK